MQTLQDLELCRLCTNKLSSNIVNLNALDTDRMKYIDKLKFVFNMEQLNDEIRLPASVCAKCCNQLKQSYEFKNQCIHSTNFWSQQLQKLNHETLLRKTENINLISIKPTEINCDTTENNIINEKLQIEVNNMDDVVHNREQYKDINSSSTESDVDDFQSNDVEQDKLRSKNKVINDTLKCEASMEVVKEKSLSLAIDQSTCILDEKNNIFFCKKCNKHFANKNGLKVHLLRKTGYKPFSCNICDKKTYSDSDLKSHMRVHDDNLPFNCKICLKSFRDETRLKIHTLIHEEIRPHMCEICGKSYARDSNLRAHLLSHSDEKKFPCKLCQNKFKSASGLKVHMDRHKNRKFICKICDKMYQSTAGYYFHLKSHNEKKIKCNLCDKTFHYKSKLNLHIRSHTNESSATCPICKKQFMTKGVLKDHLLVHTGERPHVCKVCNKTFRQSGTLSVHMRLHTGVRPYKCQLCEKTFIKSHHFGNHMKRHHNSSIAV